MSYDLTDLDEPTADDLATIQREEPLIAAEVRLVDAEIRVLTAEPHPTELDWRRLRRAEQRVIREALDLAGTHGAAALTSGTAA